MSQRRIVIGAIGGDNQQSSAKLFGAALAHAGCILLTGGGVIVDEEVKNATVQGMREAGDGSVLRHVGVIPSSGAARLERNGSQILIYTGQEHNIRNFLNGVTPDAVVVFGGGCGTLAEAAFALAAGRKLYFYGVGTKGRAVDRLRRNFKELCQSDKSEFYLSKPLRTWPSLLEEVKSSAHLLGMLDCQLQLAEQWILSADEMIDRCILNVMGKGRLSNTGFPGIPGIEATTFENEISRISQ